MNFESGRHCKIIRSMGVPLGLWPYRRTIFSKLNGAIVVTILVLCILAQLAVFITHAFSVDLFLKAVTGIEPLTICVVKYLIFVWNTDQVKYVFEWIQSDYDSLTDERERRLIEKFADRGTIISKSILYCLPLVLIPLGFPFVSEFFNIETFVNQSRSVLIIFNVEYFVDQDRYFYWIIFHIDATMVLGCTIVIVTESTIVHFTTHACGLLEVIGDRMERVLESTIFNVSRGKTYLAIHGQLVATITLHQRTLKFIENINTSLLPHYCILIAIGVASLSAHLYIVSNTCMQMILVNTRLSRRFSRFDFWLNVARAMLLMKITGETLTALILVGIHFFYMGCGNYIAQILLDKGNDLFMRTYYARWHESPLPVQKMLLYMRQRSMQPTGLVFGGLYTGSIEFFAQLLNASMSYFTVLYSAA